MSNEKSNSVETAEAKPGCAPATGSETVEEYKYLEIKVTRTQGSLVFLKVPKDFNHRTCVNLKEILAAACVATCSDNDWDANGWEDTVEWQSIKPVTKKEAEAYLMYEVESPNEKGQP
jgi:hypothetical protein